MRRITKLAVALAVVAAACTGSGGADGAGSEAREPSAPTSSVESVPDEGRDSSASAPRTEPADEYQDARLAMVADQIEARAIDDPAVLEAMRTVPRHRFVPDRFVGLAYSDQPLPIGSGQTISQPYIVALMTDLLDVEPGDKVLEVGTGSGYQAAVLAELEAEVYSVEIIPELAAAADTALSSLDYDVTLAEADGYFGWKEHAPFDAIIVTAAPDHVPQPLVEQLSSGGRLVIPVGPIGAVQTMWRFNVDSSGELVGQNFGPVQFVPFTRSG
jgi:protein-L-isoaspartate(D-aspartate) O-methyltransferase